MENPITAVPKERIGVRLALFDGSEQVSVGTDWHKPDESVPFGEWTHVAAVVDRGQPPGEIRLFVDCEQRAAQSIPAGFGGVSTGTDLYMNRIYGFSNSSKPSFGEGALYEVEVIDRAVPAEVIKALYEAGAHGKCKQSIKQ